MQKLPYSNIFHPIVQVYITFMKRHSENAQGKVSEMLLVVHLWNIVNVHNIRCQIIMYLSLTSTWFLLVSGKSGWEKK